LIQEKLKELLKYCPMTGLFFDAVNSELVGKKLDGYLYYYYKGRNYPLHRLALLYVTGVLPKGDVDHINMDRSDNRYENLRECSRSENMLNTKPHKDSRSGIKNVFYRADTGKYSVRISVAGKYKSYGCYDDLEMAELVAIEARNKFHGAFARHV
jgi:hypothetical protein